MERIQLFAKVRLELAGTHNESTINLTIAVGNAAPTSAAHQANDLLALSPWNGLLRGERRFAQQPGSWTINAWLDDGGGPSRLDPNALQDMVVLCNYMLA